MAGFNMITEGYTAATIGWVFWIYVPLEKHFVMEQIALSAMGAIDLGVGMKFR